jgi:hypothetical protein
MSKQICNICDEKTTQLRTTTCPYCQFNACRTCVRKYVLNETEPKCMNCKKVWTRTHQNAILLPSFVNDQLRDHLEQVYYEREMALFPATIEIIEDRRMINRLHSEYRLMMERHSMNSAKIRYLTSIIRENKRLIALNKEQPKMYSDINVDEINAEIKRIKIQYNIEKEEQQKDQERINVLNRLIAMHPEDRKIVMSNYIEGADPAEILETLRQSGQMGEVAKRARTQFIRACPIETCRGFLSQQWKCGLCNVFTCPKCNVPKTNVPKSKMETNRVNSNKKSSDTESTIEETGMEGFSNQVGVETTESATHLFRTENITDTEEHVCNPDDVATAELLAKDTKPCPQCGTGIFKIDGCDQMWCTECKTAFNWRTGQLETGHVHNPHYFEYQRRIGADVRNILDMPCNALAPDQYHGIIQHLIQIATNTASCPSSEHEFVLRGLKPIPKEMRRRLRERAVDYAVSIEQFADRLLPRYRPDAIQNNQELRVQYLTEQITKDDFKTALSREAKQFNKKREIGQVIQTVVFGMSDILTRLVNVLRENHDRDTETNYIDTDKIFALFSEIDVLIEYANECLEFICKQYKLTRVAMFVRDNGKKIYQPGLYTAKMEEETTPDGRKQMVLYPGRYM